MKVAIDTDINHEPDDLCYHENEPNDKKTFLEQRFARFTGKILFGLVGFELDSSTLAIKVVVEVNGMYLTELNFLKVEIRGDKRAIIVVHEGLGFHLGDFIIETIDSAFGTTIYKDFFVLGQVIEGFHVMVIIGASVAK